MASSRVESQRAPQQSPNLATGGNTGMLRMPNGSTANVSTSSRIVSPQFDPAHSQTKNRVVKHLDGPSGDQPQDYKNNSRERPVIDKTTSIHSDDDNLGYTNSVDGQNDLISSGNYNGQNEPETPNLGTHNPHRRSAQAAGEPQKTGLQLAHESLKGRIFRSTERKWALGALALSTLGIGATGATLIGLGKGALLTAGVFTLMGGPVGTVIGLSIYLGVVGLGILATYVGHKIGQSKGKRQADNLKMNDATVKAQWNREIAADIEKNKLPNEYSKVLEEVHKELSSKSPWKRGLTEDDKKGIKDAMSDYLRDQLRYFKGDFSVADARATLREFGECMAKEIRQGGDGGKGKDAAYFYQKSRTHGGVLLRLLVKTPPARAAKIAREQTRTLVHWNNYVRRTAKEGYPIENQGAALQAILRDRAEHVLSDSDRYDSNVATSKKNDAISTALYSGKPARKLYEDAARLKRALPSATCVTAETCHQRNALLKHAFLAIAPDSTSSALQEKFRQLDSANSSQQGASPSRADKRVFLAAVPLAANHAARRHMASVAHAQNLKLEQDLKHELRLNDTQILDDESVLLYE